MNDAGSLRVQGLSFCFAGQTQALLTVPGLEVRAGHSLGISGVSGAGKTTLFHCLAGIARPTAGRIVWGGTDLCALKPDAMGRWRSITPSSESKCCLGGRSCLNDHKCVRPSLDLAAHRILSARDVQLERKSASGEFK